MEEMLEINGYWQWFEDCCYSPKNANLPIQNMLLKFGGPKLLLMEEILHSPVEVASLSVYPIIHRASNTIPGGDRRISSILKSWSGHLIFWAPPWFFQVKKTLGVFSAHESSKTNRWKNQPFPSKKPASITFFFQEILIRSKFLAVEKKPKVFFQPGNR